MAGARVVLGYWDQQESFGPAGRETFGAMVPAGDREKPTGTGRPGRMSCRAGQEGGEA